MAWSTLPAHLQRLRVVVVMALGVWTAAVFARLSREFAALCVFLGIGAGVRFTSLRVREVAMTFPRRAARDIATVAAAAPPGALKRLAVTDLVHGES